ISATARLREVALRIAAGGSRPARAGPRAGEQADDSALRAIAAGPRAVRTDDPPPLIRSFQKLTMPVSMATLSERKSVQVPAALNSAEGGVEHRGRAVGRGRRGAVVGGREIPAGGDRERIGRPKTGGGPKIARSGV